VDDTIKVSVLQCGSVVVASCQLFNTAGKGLLSMALFNNRKPDQRVTIPVYASLIEHPKGKMLFDTGWTKRIRENMRKEMGIERLTDIPTLPEGQAVDEQLAARGLSAEDMDYIFLSHLHSDHVGGLGSLGGAKRIMVNDVEWAAANDRHNHLVYATKYWQGMDITTYHMEETGIGPVGRSYDVFGDGTVLMVSLPGHTLGLAGCLIRNHGKKLLLAADCGFNRESWRQMIMPTLCPDKDGIVRSYNWINELMNDAATLDCTTAHESDLPNREFEL